MRFIITAQSDAASTPSDPSAAFDAELFKAYMRFNEEMHTAGVLIASEGLNPAAQGARIAVADGKRYVVDGPFASPRSWWVASTSSKSPRSKTPYSGRCARRPAWATDDILDIRQLTGSDDMPADLLRLIEEAAPTWSADTWQSRCSGTTKPGGARRSTPDSGHL